jgi:predicted Zn-dependent protease
MFMRQDYGTAAQMLERALAITPDDPRGQYYYAATLAQMGQTDDARQIMRALAERDPDHKYGQWAQRFLDGEGDG